MSNYTLKEVKFEIYYFACQTLLFCMSSYIGYDEFAKTLENSKTACLKGIKKEPTGSFECVSPSTTCMKWWRIGDSNS